MSAHQITPWQDDVMSRHLIANFIYDVIDKRHLSNKHQGAICMALDGEWGS
jgi:hypothetical protein